MHLSIMFFMGELFVKANETDVVEVTLLLASLNRPLAYDNLVRIGLEEECQG